MRTLSKLLSRGIVALLFVPSALAGLVIVPMFDSSITGNANAAQIESAINTATSTLENLYSNSVTIPVTFTYGVLAGDLLDNNTDEYYSISYSSYVSLLKADSAANPNNTALALALANLGSGNDSSGTANMAINGNQLLMLGITDDPGDSVININSTQPFSFSRPVGSGDYDAIGGIEHELDEVLGVGGGASTLNECLDGKTFFCGKYGSTDPYRYSAPGIPSFTTSSSATSYFSIDGGVTQIVQANQNSSGDFADFAPPCGTGSGTLELVQNAFNCTSQYEAYTRSSSEFTMMEAVGWDPTPEPSPFALLAIGFILCIWQRRTAWTVTWIGRARRFRINRGPLAPLVASSALSQRDGSLK
jgi:hypothetical protein